MFIHSILNQSENTFFYIEVVWEDLEALTIVHAKELWIYWSRFIWDVNSF